MKEEVKPVAFFNKSNPSGGEENVDIVELIIKHNRVFIGYPPWKKGKTFDKDKYLNNINDYMFDISKSLEKKEVPEYRRTMKENENLVNKIGNDSIVVIPRLSSGICYVAKVKSFKLVNKHKELSKLFKDYIDLRKKNKASIKKTQAHMGDVVQSWPIDGELKKISFTKFPRWITKSFFCRKTAGLIHDTPEGTSAYDVIKKIYHGENGFDLDEIDSTESDVLTKIENRLKDMVSPSILEHLTCELLQLKNSNECWIHVGGAGDGGVDGLGYDKDLNLVGVLQCKWKHDGDLKNLFDDLKKQFENGRKIKIYISILFHDKKKIKELKSKLDSETEGILDVEKIAKMLKEHKDKCPFAKTLRIK